MKKTIEDFIGNTPLVRLQRLDAEFEKNRQCRSRQAGGQQPGRLGQGPAGDLHDPARRERGTIKPGDTLIEPTSGNTGIALAMAAAITRLPHGA